MKRTLILFGGWIVIAVLFGFWGYKNAKAYIIPVPNPEDGEPVQVSAKLFYNRDSVMYYYEKGMLENDPKGLFVMSHLSMLLFRL